MITSLCNTAILMDQGRLIAQGPAPEIVNRYYSQSIDSPYSIDFQNRQKIPGDHLARLLNATVEDGNGRPCGEIDIRSPLQVRMRFSLHGAEGRRPIPNFHVYNPQGQCVFVSCASVDMADTRDGIYEAVAKIPALFLNSDTYFIDLGLTFTDGIMHVSFHERSVLSMVIVDPIEETLESLRKGYSGPMPGAVRPYLDWTVERLS
jgi:lipopolysaccharide transport system ATP-binding protein